MDPRYLHERLRYEPSSGKLFWREHPALPPKWNGRWAGREAFTAESNGYRVGRLDGRKHYAHRVIYAMLHGRWPEQIDHEDHDRVNNRPRNLKAATNATNGKNQSGRANSSSGALGVCWYRASGQWHARITVDGTTTHLGYYPSLSTAVMVRRAAEQRHAFHANHGKSSAGEQHVHRP